MAFPGGKAGAGTYQTIINQIPPHAVYIEPFLGAGAILRHKRPAARSCAVEIDGSVLDAWIGGGDVGDAVSCAGIPNLELYHCDGIEWLRHFFGFYRAAVAAGACDGPPLDPATPPAASRAHATSAEVACNGAARATHNRATFVYCDPPYPLASRRSGRLYDHELTDEDHANLVATLKHAASAGAMVCVSSYDNPLYREALDGWRTVRFWSTTRGGRMAEECLWMNYPEPDELHDYRYLGSNKRQREKLRRRIRNWTRALQRLPKKQRDAMVQEMLAALYGDPAGPTQTATKACDARQCDAADRQNAGE